MVSCRTLSCGSDVSQSSPLPLHPPQHLIFQPLSFEGVLSSVMRHACSDEKPDEKWILLDGPVDTLWIESMNSVMDDNKVLTLINGERISMPDQVSLCL